jgi:acetyl esterase/lipase
MDVRLDVYSQPSGAGHPVLVFVHGGRWGEFRKELFAGVAQKLMPEGLVVVVPDHTLYPDATCGQMVREVAAAVSWTLENVEQYRGDPGRVVVAGHSSGGHLLGLAVLDGQSLRAHGHTRDEVCGMIGISAGYDISAQYTFEEARNGVGMMETLVGVMDGRENFHSASPISYVAPDVPPVLLIHGDADRTVPVEQAIEFHAALQRVGGQSELKVYPGRGHSEIFFTAMNEERPQLVVDIARFVHGCSAV